MQWLQHHVNYLEKRRRKRKGMEKKLKNNQKSLLIYLNAIDKH